MKKVELKDVTIGNFAYSATLEITEEVENALLEQGALRILQGKVSGQWEKSLAYPGTGVKRPEGFNRKSIPFSADAADALVREYQGAKVEIGRTEDDKAILADLGVTEMVVTEYTGAAAAEPKYKAEKDMVKIYLTANEGKLKDGSPRSAAAFAESRGIVAPTEPWEEDTEFLKGVKAWYAAKMAAEASEE